MGHRLQDLAAFRWLGSDTPHLDTPSATLCRQVVIGCYGGHTAAGADRNEDAALVCCAPDGAWEFAMVLDAHGSADSARLVLATVEAEQCVITPHLAQPVEAAFTSLHQHLLSLFRSPAFREQCRHVRGETACLIAVRSDRFLWWFSIGDCLVYLFHPDLARLGQFALNQRSFFEWIGRASSFDLPVPCSASGIRELRDGQNVIVLATDGLLECGARPFADPQRLYDLLAASDGGGNAAVEAAVRAALARVHQEQGRDSATLIAWSCEIRDSGLWPSSGKDRATAVAGPA